MEIKKLNLVLNFIDKNDKAINNEILIQNDIKIFENENEFEECLNKIENDGHLQKR